MPSYRNLGVSDATALRLERSLLADHILGARKVVKSLRAELVAADMSIEADPFQRNAMLWQRGRLFAEEQHLKGLRYLAEAMRDER